MQCHEFDGLLSDALDGVLTGLQLDRFQAHVRTCSACGPLFAEVEAGRNWLKDLTEVEPPVSLVNNILASTTGVDTQRLRVNVSAPQPRIGWVERAQAWASGAMQPIWRTVRQPRFAMSFGMAFFSLSVALSVLGVKPADLRQVSLRPAAIRHTYYNTQARVEMCIRDSSNEPHPCLQKRNIPGARRRETGALISPPPVRWGGTYHPA